MVSGSSVSLQPTDDGSRIFVRLGFAAEVTGEVLHVRVRNLRRNVEYGITYFPLCECVEDGFLDAFRMLAQAHVLQHHYAT